jgi:hypothetical protein
MSSIRRRTVRPAVGSDELVLPAVGADRVRVRVHVTDRSGVANVALMAVPDLGPEDLLAILDPDGDGEPDESALESMEAIFQVREMRLVSGTARDGVWSGVVALNAKSFAGSYAINLMATDKAGNMAMTGSGLQLTARYRTAVRGFDVSPEGAAQGSAVTVSGRLMHVTRNGWAGFGNRELKVQFRPAGATTWTTKGTLRTRADGSFSNSTKFHANRSGSWRVAFTGGTSNAPSASPADLVTLG